MEFNIKKALNFFSYSLLFAICQANSSGVTVDHSMEPTNDVVPMGISSDEKRRNAIHSGHKTSSYVKGKEVLVDLTKLEISSDPTRVSSGLTIEQKDKIWHRLAEELPAGTDFAILSSKLRDGNTGLVGVYFTAVAGNLSFDGIDFVLNVDNPSGSGWGVPSAGKPYYFLEPWSWTKETGLGAVEKAFKEGASEVEATIVFRDKYDPKLVRKNPYREVMIYLQDGQDRYDAYLQRDNTASFGTKLRFDQIDYLQKHPLVVNVVPNLPEPK